MGIDRRRLLAGMAAGAVIAGFDTQQRVWVAHADTAADFSAVPPLDGVLLTDSASRTADSVDQGNLVQTTPSAVLRPGSIADIQRMVAYCAQRGIKVAPRGQAHTTFGQSLVGGGLIIEMHWLNQIHSITSAGADADAGVLWRDLVHAAAAQGLRAAGLTGYLGLTLGGTLAVGGISENYKEGGQVDRVQSVDVVTGAGTLLHCSPTQNADLFNAVLAGLGQCGIMVRVKIDLLPAPDRIRTYQLTYTDLGRYFQDLRLLANRGEVDGLFTLWQPMGTSVVPQLQVQAYYNVALPPNDTYLLRGTSAAPGVLDQSYLDNVTFFDNIIQGYQANGWDRYIKPWFDVFLPDETIEDYLKQVMPALGPESWSPTGFMLTFIHNRASFQKPFFRVPGNTKWVYLFDILNDSRSPGPNPAFVQQMLVRNQNLWAQAKAAGGTRYPIGTMQFSQDDWVQQYGPMWPALQAAKATYDPAGILTPGPGIF